ncbi:diguanylate cyclase domain-containing protein [Thalassotalea marina]|uniref:GGDEF domain-containing protein n=1 Tax=Thalassotalea marina TaxID=1673741 RepID=A0A919ENH6_9GAMM|nr:GGDEF domain-containing protein [Thalassotalea marina]GHG04826.1 hypothetical protein GCM10017161_38070 [Thalassotalea marina]
MTTSRVINEVASVKKTILMALAALSLLLVSELALTHYDNVEVGLIICITGLILLYWWANSDTVQVIRGLILWGISTLVFYLSWEQNGIYNSALFAYPCIILLAYTMGSKMLVIPIFLAIAMQVIILALAHEVNLIEILEENPNSYRIRAVDILVVLILFGSISYVFIHNFKQALKKRAKSIATLQDQLEKANKLLDYDELTSLAKESVFERELNEILVTRTNNLRVAVFILDFPSLQQLNNTLGRQLGDLTVAQVAGRLNSMMQNGERVYRLSGHSFALLKVSESSKESDLFRERLLQAMSTKFDVHGIEVSLFCLLGVAVAPFDG